MYCLKSLTLATLVFSLLLPMGAAQSRTKGIFQKHSPTFLVTQRQTEEQRKKEALWILELGIQQSTQYQYQEALETFRQALVIYKQIGNKEIEGAILFRIGTTYQDLGQYPQALEFYEQGLTIFKAIGDKQGESLTLIGIGLVYKRLSQDFKALSFYQQALAIAKEIGDKPKEMLALNNIGQVYNNQGQYAKALEFYQQSLAISKQIDDKAKGSLQLNNIGQVYNNQGQYTKALEFYQQALAIYKQIGDKAGEGTALRALGNVYNKQGQYAKALDISHQALAISKQIGDKAEEAGNLNVIGMIYHALGQYAKALDISQQALVIAKQTDDKAVEGSTLSNIGSYYYALGQYAKALDISQQALVIAKQTDDKAVEGTRLGKIAQIYERQREYAKAGEYYRQELAIAQQIGSKEAQASAIQKIGSVYVYLLRYAKGIDLLQQAVAISKEIGSKELEANTLGIIAVVYYWQGQYAKAETALLDTIKIFESLRVNLKDTDNISIFETQTGAYRFLQGALIAQNKNNKALEVSERGRARAFVELLASKQSLSPNQINIKSPSIQKIKQIAKQQNATLVEYSINEFQLYIWVVKPTGEITFKQVDLKSLKTPLKELVKNSRASIGAGSRGINLVPTGKRIQKANFQKLYQVLIKPIASLLPTNPDEHVIFIPHESLFLVPFVALQDKDGKYLIEKHTILTSPAIQVLELMHQQRQKVTGKDVLVMGNPTMPSVGVPPVQLPPLKYAEIEAKEIAKLENTTAIIGSNATKAVLKQKLPSAKIIHLATHGLLDDADRSIPNAIALAPSGNDDGLLTPAEIADLQINAELVVLSACDTGRGKITGDGVVGLSRSLITAGASSVIVSLWSIPDSSTSKLMSDFYERLQQNPDKAVALRQAMLNAMKKHPSPIYWAAFTLIGETK